MNLSLDLPRSSRRGPSLVGRLVFLLVVLVVGAVPGFQAGRHWERRIAGPRAPAPATAATEEPAAAPKAPAAQPAPQGALATAPQQAAPNAAAPAGQPAATGTSVTAPPVANAPPAATSPIRRLSATLHGSLEESLAGAIGPEDKQYAEQLTQVVNRLLVWHLQVSRMGLRGDKIEVLWEPPPAPGALAGVAPIHEPIVHAVKYASQKLGREIAAYRFQPEGAKWARYYQPDGTELEERLVDAPIAEYEQVTSLLRDGRKHKGVDFKTPVGTPVVAPFDGTITKRNWNWRFNGNSLEVVDAKSGRHAIFLHLDVLPKEMAPGRKVRKGEEIAKSGNTGHSFAPHLHYQLEDGNGKVLDPFQVHATKRVSLDAAKKAAFDAARARMEPQLASAR